jgi:hypothetical protein
MRMAQRHFYYFYCIQIYNASITCVIVKFQGDVQTKDILHPLSKYSLCPQMTVAVDLCATSLTEFVENMYNIFISK